MKRVLAVLLVGLLAGCSSSSPTTSETTVDGVDTRTQLVKVVSSANGNSIANALVATPAQKSQTNEFGLTTVVVDPTGQQPTRISVTADGYRDPDPDRKITGPSSLDAVKIYLDPIP